MTYTLKLSWSRLALAGLLLGAPVSGFAQSILLTASNFSLLGGSAITNTGLTVISDGNVGLFPTAESAITGIPPAVITNGSIVATGPVTQQAQLDLMTAATGLAGMPSDRNLSGQDLGGMTLAPGVYTFDAAAAQTGNLILDAQGRNNAYWVFQISTTLTTFTGANVTVINYGSHGGDDDGVFWDAGSAITIGVNNVVLGNYLAGTSITLGTSTHGEARNLALAAISLDNNIVSAQGGPGGSDWSGGLTYDPSGNVVPVPEPAAVLWLAPLGALGWALRQRHAGTRVK
jgi:hypothetical protein